MIAFKKRLKIFSLFNIDINVVLSLLNSLWSIAKTPLALILITTKLSSTEQGYWYTFLSLGALSVFAEMGFTTIVTQFLSYEFAHLELDSSNMIVGSQDNINKFTSLIKYTIRKYLKIIPLGIGFILIIGFLFFRKDLYYGDVLYCWLLYAFAGGTTLFLSLLTSIIRGINKVKDALQITFVINLLNTATLCLCLFLGLGLWSLCISAFITFLASLIIIYYRFKFFFIQILKYKVKGVFDWKKEINSLQTKYSISWIAGYFIFSFIVPVTMYFLGPIQAGKVGITISLGAAILQMAHSWVANKMPELNMAISVGKEVEAKNIFFINNRSSLIFFLFASIVVITSFYFDIFSIFGFKGFVTKFISIYGIIAVLVAEFFKLLLGNWAVFLRAYKQEPYLKITLINAFSTILVFCLFMGIYKSLFYSLLLFAFIQILSAILGRKIFTQKFNECY